MLPSPQLQKALALCTSRDSDTFLPNSGARAWGHQSGQKWVPVLLFVSHSLALGHHTRQDGDRAEEVISSCSEGKVIMRARGEACVSGRRQIWWQDAGLGTGTAGWSSKGLDWSSPETPMRAIAHAEPAQEQLGSSSLAVPPPLR